MATDTAGTPSSYEWGITEAKHKALAKEFPSDKVQGKKGRGGKAMKYISHGLITERLNQVDPNWSSQMIAEHIYYDDQKRPHCAGITLALTVGGITRVETGGPQHITGMGDAAAPLYLFADEIKNAYSDAIKRCAMRFAVALSMWEDLIDAEGDEDVQPKNVVRQEPPSNFQPVNNVNTNSSNGSQSSGSGPSPKQISLMESLANQLGWTKQGPDGGMHHDPARMDQEVRNLGFNVQYTALSGGRDGESSKVIDEWMRLAKEARLGGGSPPVSGGSDDIPDWGAFYSVSRAAGINNKSDFERAMGAIMPGTPQQALDMLNAKMKG